MGEPRLELGTAHKRHLKLNSQTLRVQVYPAMERQVWSTALRVHYMLLGSASIAGRLSMLRQLVTDNLPRHFIGDVDMTIPAVLR